MHRFRLFAVLTLACLALATLPPADAADGLPPAVDFNRDIRPILSNNCLTCHGPDEKERQGGTDGLRLDVRGEAVGDLGGYAAIVPGQPGESELIRRITTSDAGELMPPQESGKRLTPREIELLTRWIERGAEYAQHWAYVKPVRPEVPSLSPGVQAGSSQPVAGLEAGAKRVAGLEAGAERTSAIDAFILARLAREGLAPSPEADVLALLRRVSLDLTGLPPTLDDLETHDRPDAYERYVDKLLASPAFGEHWAHAWLDLARYADSAGYADDPPRTIWLYRDYVIRSLNANKPFDQFTIEQIAGDLLPEPTEEPLIATAFHRNTLTNNEGGTSDEEFRNVAVVDRVNTTMAVWMGTTMACAQCHSHKYDPISQEEYFRFFAIFNNTEDADRKDETPVFERWTDELLERQRELQRQIAELEADTAEEAAKRREELKKKLADIKPLTTVPIMRELPQGKRRVTRIQHRGNFLDLGAEVVEGTPGVFHPLPGEAPANRLDLARWLVDEENPLTARVVANRFWEQIFGIGLVATSEEFGSQGEPPSHPELLDWLATELVRLQWDQKAFLRLLVTSATYRQSARVTPDSLARDPDNRLLARGPRLRLSAETIRDQALAVSGLLSTKMHGPPVKPPQPAVGLTAAFGSGIDWQPSSGADRYRRGLYTTWRRSNPYPSMTTFDAPNREVCTIRRSRTNTPLQALVTLNDPVYVEAAQALARRIVAEGGQTPAECVRYAVQVCLARPPQDTEQERLLAFYEEALAQFRADADAARKMATDPLGPLPPDADSAELAAWTAVSNVLLNLDEMLMKR